MRFFLIILFIGQLLAAKLPVVEIIGTLRPRNVFVEDVLEISEDEFAKKPAIGRKALFDSKCGKDKDFECGLFEQQSLKDLRANLPESSKNKGSFNVIEAKNPKSNLLDLQQVDTGALQVFWGRYCQAKGKRLTVMVASNSNALETTSPDDTPLTITQYIGDPTQGPAASMSAAPATLWRHYFAFYKQGDTSGEWDQMQKARQINFLDNLLSEFKKKGGVDVKVPNGYLILPSGPKQLNELADFFQQNSDLIKVGVHTNLSVSHGFDHLNFNIRCFMNNKKDRPLINQVFCAALNMEPDAGGHDSKNPKIRKIAEILLKKQVEATILAAWKNNTDILLLTLLGCGVFKNDKRWLADELTLHKEIIEESGMRVVLNCFAKQEDGYFKDSLIKLVKETGGSYLRYSQKGEELFCENLVTQDPQYKVGLSARNTSLATEIKTFKQDQERIEDEKREQVCLEENKKFAKSLTSAQCQSIFNDKSKYVAGFLDLTGFIDKKEYRWNPDNWESYLSNRQSKVLDYQTACKVIQDLGVYGVEDKKVRFKDFEPGIKSIAEQCGPDGFKAVLRDALEAIRKEEGVQVDKDKTEGSFAAMVKSSLGALQISMVHLKKALAAMSDNLKKLHSDIGKLKK